MAKKSVAVPEIIAAAHAEASGNATRSACADRLAHGAGMGKVWAELEPHNLAHRYGISSREFTELANEIFRRAVEARDLFKQAQQTPVKEVKAQFERVQRRAASLSTALGQAHVVLESRHIDVGHLKGGLQELQEDLQAADREGLVRREIDLPTKLGPASAERTFVVRTLAKQFRLALGDERADLVAKIADTVMDDPNDPLTESYVKQLLDRYR